MIVLYILGYFCRNKQSSYAALSAYLYSFHYIVFIFYFLLINKLVDTHVLDCFCCTTFIINAFNVVQSMFYFFTPLPIDPEGVLLSSPCAAAARSLLATTQTWCNRLNS